MMTQEKPPQRIVLLGPQRLAPRVGPVAQRLGIAGDAAIVSAGWQERELETENLLEHLHLPGRNLCLYGRWEELAKSDPEFFRAHRKRQDVLRALGELYDKRLRYVIGAARDMLDDVGPEELVAPERASALEALRALDAHHLRRVAAVHAAFEEQARPHANAGLQRHRAEIAEILGDCAVVCVAGGHVGVLLARLRLFGLAQLIGDRHVLAWSGGAMVCCERILLFHDHPPQGAGNAEVFEHGLGVARGVIALPHARRRLDLAAPLRLRLMARRLAPSRPVALDEGCWLALDAAGSVVDAEQARFVTADGELVAVTPADVPASAPQLPGGGGR